MIRRGGTRVYGEANGQSKLTEEQVRWIKATHVPHSHRYGTAALARQLGVSYECVFYVVHGITWAHVD